jgi:superfamily II DNA or RNA helicase
MEIIDKPTLLDKLYVPTHLVPFNALSDFMATVRDVEGNDNNLQFFEHDYESGISKFARGDLDLLNKHFGQYGIEDKRAVVPLGIPLEFSGTLRHNQQTVVDSVLKSDGAGLVSAPPRFGKTVVMTYLTCKIAQKTLFLSHQIDLSKQALKTFWKMTNILDLEYDANKQLIGIVEKWEDLDRFHICFMPYQKFIQNEKSWKKLADYRDKFGLVFVDEVHRSNAPQYSKVVSSFNSRWRLGVSATVKIKSGMDVVSQFIVGPIIAKGVADQVPCQVRIVKTGIVIPFRCVEIKTFFQAMWDFLNNHNVRNDFIIEYIAAYARSGHYCIAMAERTKMLDYITNGLKQRGIVAQSFHSKSVKGKKQREDILQKARKGEIQVLVANRSMTLGLDIPRLTTFFNLTPSSNQPNYYQDLSRVRTPYENKNLAYIIDFEDWHPIAKNCLNSRLKVYKRNNFEVLFV